MSKKITKKTANKIGLIYSISILVGTVVGVGIFLKNGNIFLENGNNPIGVIIAWIIAALISLCAAWSFSEIGSSGTDHEGLGRWCKKFISPKFGKIISMIQPFFYYIVISFSISMYGSEILFSLFDFDKSIHFSIIMIVGFLIFLSFLLLNFLSLNVSKKLQLSLSFLKIIPIIMVIIVGIIYAIKFPNLSLFNPNNNQSNLSFTSIIISLPSILFAFDSFTGVGNLSLEIKNPKKNIPLTIVIGMGLVVILYLLITISLIFTGQGNSLNIFGNLFSDPHSANIFKLVFTFFLLVSVLGVINGFSAISIRACSSLVENNLIYKANDFDKFVNTKIFKKQQNNSTGFIYNLIFYSILFIIIFIPSSINNTDAYMDGITNFPTTIFFGIYGIAIIGGIWNRKTKKIETKKVKGFLLFAPIGAFGCMFIFLFQSFYTFTFRNIIEANQNANWGLFYDNNIEIKVWESSIFFISYILIIFIYAITNLLLMNKEKTKKLSFNINTPILKEYN